MSVVAPPLPELVSFLENLAEPHILCDRDYRILAANAAYREQCGGQPDVVGRTCYEISHHYSVPCDQVGEACPLARSLESGQCERAIHLHHTSSGQHYENIDLSPLRDASGEIAYFVERLQPLPITREVEHQHGLIGSSPAFTRLLELVARVAPSEAAVLLQGESGTGKELLAQAIHSASPRAQRPFVVVDCSGLPEALFESELFGHERGAFTGASARKPGLVEAASGGTLFLDEVGDIPLSMQVKLLRLIESGTYRRVGSTDLRRADVRLVSATHRSLSEMVRDGRFRQDLYYRLNTFPIPIPALRERRADLPALVTALLERVAPKRKLRVSPAAFVLLQNYEYPGNIRELRNLLERASLMCDASVIEPGHLPPELTHPADAPPEVPMAPNGGAAAVRTTLRDIEQETLRLLVEQHRGTRRELADQLGLSERTLYRKIRQLGR